MSDFTSAKSVDGLSVKLWRGQRMVLIGMDVDDPEPDFVGFSIEVQAPGAAAFVPLRNRLKFEDTPAVADAVMGYRNYDSTEAPFQKFRWVHFPDPAPDGEYTYRVTKLHSAPDHSLRKGTSATLDITLDPVFYDGLLEVGFTRNFASSQAYVDRYKNDAAVIPAKPAAGLAFEKPADTDVYSWLGFEAYRLLFEFLRDAAADATVSIDCFAYDLNEPDIVGLLEQLGDRLRIIIDDSADHKPPSSAESKAAARLRTSAGGDNVQRMHFKKLQHNKVLIAKRGGTAIKVLFGSTNFSFRGIYVQANNALVFHAEEAASLFEQVFQRAFTNPAKFNADPLATQWHLVQLPDKPPVHFCFSPHTDANLSLGPVGAAIDQASSSVLFSIAFLNQATSGPVREAIDRLEDKTVFSYGISDKSNGLNIKKPDGTEGIVSFAYLAANAPEPFKSEWDGGAGIHEHHKFVVTDFSLPTARVFTGSCNMSMSGEQSNGDNLVMIEDPRIATAYAVEAIRVFDHLHFRTRMQAAGRNAPKTLMLARPAAGKPTWFARYYEEGSQAMQDRKLFSR